MLYHRGLSYRDTSKILGVIEPSSYEAVHYWYKQFQELFAIGPKERRAIALDETKVKRCNKQVFLWTAVDVDSHEVLGVYISETRSGLDTYSFLKYVLRFCTNKPAIIGDKALGINGLYRDLDLNTNMRHLVIVMLLNSGILLLNIG